MGYLFNAFVCSITRGRARGMKSEIRKTRTIHGDIFMRLLFTIGHNFRFVFHFSAMLLIPTSGIEEEEEWEGWAISRVSVSSSTLPQVNCLSVRVIPVPGDD